VAVNGVAVEAGEGCGGDGKSNEAAEDTTMI